MIRRILFCCLALSLLAAGPASAHQRLVSASPAAGDSLHATPTEIRLSFDQAVDVALASLRLLGPDGEVTLGALAVTEDAPKVLRARIDGPLREGSFTVEWLVTGTDGHPVRGEYRFEIAPGAEGLTPAPDSLAAASVAAGEPGPGAAAGDQAPTGGPEEAAGVDGGFHAGSPLYAAVRWLTFAGMVVAIGAVAFVLLLLRSLTRRGMALPTEALGAARARAATVALGAAAALAVALVLRLVAQATALHDAVGAGSMMRQMLTRTFWGWGWLLQAAATVVLVAGLMLARRGGRRGWGLVAPAVVALAFTPALSGHAVATSPLAVVSDWVHVLAAGGWLGTLLLMLLVGLPLLARQTGSSATAAAALVDAFTPFALACAAALTLTGVFAAWLHLPEIASLWSTAYGQVLLAKLAALLLVFAAGAYNWLRVKPALSRSADAAPLRRSGTVEVTMGALVLAVTAVLVATPPPPDPAPVAIQPTADSTSIPSPSRP